MFVETLPRIRKIQLGRVECLTLSTFKAKLNVLRFRVGNAPGDFEIDFGPVKALP